MARICPAANQIFTTSEAMLDIIETNQINQYGSMIEEIGGTIAEKAQTNITNIIKTTSDLKGAEWYDNDLSYNSYNNPNE